MAMIDHKDARALVNDFGSRHSDTSKLTHFNRFRVTEKEDFATSGISYVFFTRPDCNVKDKTNRAADSYLDSLNGSAEGRHILNYLSASSGQYFMQLLTNSAENFELKDTILRTNELSENFIGHKISVPSTIIDSVTVDQFSINYTEYADLSIIKLHKLWVEYMNNVRRGIFVPSEYNKTNRIIDYMSSVYFFKLSEDGHTIKYWAKYTGVYPTNIPYSSMSFELGHNAVKKLSVNYSYSFKEDMKPEILMDFMALSNKGSAKKINDTLDANWALRPYIDGNGKLKFGN